MERKDFIKKSLLAGVVGAIVPSTLKADNDSTYDRLMERVGFNHLPNKEYNR